MSTATSTSAVGTCDHRVRRPANKSYDHVGPLSNSTQVFISETIAGGWGQLTREVRLGLCCQFVFLKSAELQFVFHLHIPLLLTCLSLIVADTLGYRSDVYDYAVIWTRTEATPYITDMHAGCLPFDQKTSLSVVVVFFLSYD